MSIVISRLTHTDLKPENILFTSSDWEISYNARKVRFWKSGRIRYVLGVLYDDNVTFFCKPCGENI